MTSSSINTAVISAPGVKGVAKFTNEFAIPTKAAIAALETQLAMIGTQWAAAEVTAAATTLVASGGVTKPMSLTEILKIAGSVHPFITATALELAGDGVTDDGPALQRGAELWSGRGGAVFFLKALPGQSFYFKGTPRMASNITTIFASPRTVTATSRLTLQGAPALDSNATGLTLISDAAVAATSAVVSTAAAGGGLLSSRIPVDSTLWITGQRDSCGTPLQEQLWVRVTAVDDGLNTLTFAGHPLSYTFEATYTAGDYEAETGVQNKTLLSRVVVARAASNVSAGSNLWPIESADIGNLTEGDLVIVFDEKKCSDVAGTNNSLINVEMAHIVASVSGDSLASVRLSRFVERDYTTARHARLIKVNPIVNASISGDTVEFTEAPDGVVHVIEGRFAKDCRIESCTEPNTDSYGTKGNAARFDYSLSCEINDCTARGARYVDDGQGNGYVLARSTDCEINDCTADGMRHGIQMLTSTNCSYSNNKIQNARHTPIDHHGANSIGCVGYDNMLTASTTYEAAPTKAPPAVVFGNPTLLAGDHRCGFVGGRIKGYKDPTGSSHEGALQFFPPSTGCFLRNVEFVDIGKFLTFEDVASYGTLVTSGHRISGCSVDGCADYLIDGNSRINGAGVNTFTDVQITNSEFRNIGKMIRATYAGELQISNCRFDEIMPNNTYPYVAVLDTCADFYFAQNTIIGSKSGLHMTGCTGLRVLRNEFADQTAGTVFYDNGGNTGVWADNLSPGYTPSTNRTGASVLTEGPRAAGKVTMADDTAFTFIPQRTTGTVTVWSYNASTVYASVQFIAVGTAGTALVSGVDTAQIAVTAGALAGTTGTDAKFTISAHTNGQVYFENRTGSSIDIDFSVS